MKNKSQIEAFLVETFKRFGVKSPKFFQIFQYVGIAATAAGFIPDALVFLDITPTPIFSHYLEVVLKAAGIVTWIMAKLPVQNQEQVIQRTDKLPFTEKATK